MKRGARTAWHWVVGAETQPVERAHAAGAVLAVVDPEVEHHGDGATEVGTFRFERLRFLVALSIVIGAISAAAAAWRAEIFSEYATQKEALFRQDLTGQQLSLRSDEELVMSEMRAFGPYERDYKIAYQTQQEANAASGPAAKRLQAEAQNDWTIVDSVETYDFPSLNYTFGADGSPSPDPATSYGLAVLADPTLASYAPSDLDAQAHEARTDALNMGGVGVLFACAVVLFTLSEMALRRRFLGPVPRWTRGHTVGSLGVIVWIGAFVLFILLYLNVPSLT